MDSTFKRVATRRRVEELTNQLNSVQRALALEQLTDLPEGSDMHLSPHHQASVALPAFSAEQLSLRPFQNAPQVVTPSESASSNTAWFNANSLVSPPNFPQYWAIEMTTVEHNTVIDIFQQFNDFYYPHLPIIEPVTSLQDLNSSSPALFWSIVLTASRHHPHHAAVYEQLKDPFQRLLGHTLSIPLNILSDLQAVLITCHWPLEIKSQTEDPSWMHAGMAINAALQMGLDKFEDEVLFGHRRAKHSLTRFGQKYRMMTWMKCFQIGTQLSSWHGLSPPISSTSSLQKLSMLYDETSIPNEMIAMTEIQRQFARFTSILEESGTEISVSLIQMFAQDMDDIKRRFSASWSISAEINLQGAKLYLFALPLVSIDQQRLKALRGSDSAAFLHSILQWAHVAAIRLTHLMAELGGLRGAANPFCGTYESGGCPLLAHPKHHFRVTFFACIMLLKYLDCNRDASPADKEAARNAVSTTYQLFNKFQSSYQHVRASNTMEVLARMIVPDHGRMVTYVKSRLGASIIYNAVWTAATIRGRHNDPEFSTTASPSTQPNSTPSATDGTDQNMGTVADFSQGADFMPQQATTFNHSFPWGLWDDELFDALGYGWSDQPYPDMSGNMDFI